MERIQSLDILLEHKTISDEYVDKMQVCVSKYTILQSSAPTQTYLRAEEILTFF